MARARARSTRSARAAPRAARPERGPSADAPADDARYSIRVTSQLTSIELDTLRIWERRYGFPRPERTSGGSRVYSAADIEALKLIKRALDHGFRPGEVVGKTREELTRFVLAASRAPAPAEAPLPTIAKLLDALAREDLAALRAELRTAAVMRGPKGFLVDVAHPLCVRVGELWEEGKLEVRHEHMLSECLSGQLRVLMSAYEDGIGAPRVLLATLPNERHVLGLEMVQVYLAASRITPVLLGAETPPEQIAMAARSHAVDAVGLSVVQESDLADATRHLRWMLSELPRRVVLWVGGGASRGLRIRGDAVRIIGTWGDLDDAIAKLGPGPT